MPAVRELQSNRDYLEHLNVVERDPTIIRLTSNENLNPPAPGVTEAVLRALGTANLYPATNPLLRERLAERHGLTPDHILIGAGAGEVIDATIRAFAGPRDEVVVPVPTWPVYRRRLVAVGAAIREVPMAFVGAAYLHDTEKLLGALSARTKLVILCSPNNPTGNVLARRDLGAIAATGLPTLLDSAYDDFAAPADRLEGLATGRLVCESPNVLVARTFSKAYALAGARLGYLLGEPSTVECIERMLLPGSCVSSLALAAGEAALEAEEHRSKHVTEVVAERRRLTEGLRAAGLTALDSEGNFVPIATSFPGEAQSFVQQMLSQRIAVRAMSDAMVRITVGRAHENDAVLEAARTLGEEA